MNEVLIILEHINVPLMLLVFLLNACLQFFVLPGFSRFPDKAGFRLYYTEEKLSPKGRILLKARNYTFWFFVFVSIVVLSSRI